MRWITAGTVLAGVLAAGAVQASEFEFGDVKAKLKTVITLGAALRVDSMDNRLVGKLNVPGQSDLCPDGCLSFTGDPAPNERLVKAPGAFFGAVKDNGDINYRQWQPTAGGVKLSQDITATWKDFTFKFGVLAFYDQVGFNHDAHHTDTTFQPASESQNLVVREKVGRDFQLKDAFVSTHFNVLDHTYNLNVGYQHVRWGESNFIALNSLSEINPPDARLLHQPGTPISEIFRPTPVALLNTQLTENMSLDVLYQLAWVPVQIDPQGTLNSFVDIEDGHDVTLGLGQFHEDPMGLQRLPTPGNIISDTSLRGSVLPDSFGHPSHIGQFGGKLTWYLPDFNGGTELGFYALNYHSRLPYISVVAAQQSCMRDSTNIGDAFAACNGFRINQQSGLEPLPIDTLSEFLDYPENIQMFGFSFNTNVGKWSLAGEYSLRPDMPLQVQVPDVIFAGLQPAFPRQDVDINAVTASSLVTGVLSNPGALPGVLLDPSRVAAFAAFFASNATANTVIPGSRTAVPDYLEAYQHFQTRPGQVIHGWARFPVDQLDVTGIRALGNSDNPFGADQVIILVEGGFTHVWNLPDRSRIQLEGGDNNNSHASPGADGTGWPAGTPATTYSHAINPTQQVDGFGSGFAAGYRLFVRFEYDNLFWGLNFKPSIYWAHDVAGIAPQPIQNFVAGAKTYAISAAVEAGGAWSGQLTYQGSTGGGSVNTQRDRDAIAATVSYTF